MRCEKVVNGVGTREARNSEKRRDRLSITNCRFDSCDAVVNLVLDKWQRPVVEGEWVIQGVRADRMARIVDAPHQRGVGTRHLAN